MRSPIIFLLTLLLIVGCDQAPTSLEEEPYRAPQESDELTLEIVELDFDPLGKSFFFSISATSPLSDLEVVASLTSGSSFAYFELSDDGLGDDIIINDGIFNGNWQLPDSLDAYIDSSWTLEVEATVRAQSKLAQRQLTPVRPAPPLILSVSHADTLTLHPTAWVVDTMTVAVEHPQGLDEIRDVSLLSLKPDSTFANSGQPIPLYDDGGSEIFYSFNGIDYTSGDQQAGDGVYSLLLILTPGNLAGTYHWSFSSRTWLGISSEIYVDSLIVLPAPQTHKRVGPYKTVAGVFK